MSALLDAIKHVRAGSGNRTAQVMVLAPARANAVLLRQRLMVEGVWINVTFGDPDSLFHDLARPRLLEQDLRTEPSGWAELALTRALRTTPSIWSATLQQPGWLRPLSSALQTLTDVDLTQTTVPHAPLELLRELQQSLDAERQAAGFATAAQVVEAASAGLNNPHLPANRPQGVVLFGDRVLNDRVHETVEKWLRERAVVQLLSSAFANLDPAPHGLRAAALDAPVLELRGAPTSQLGSLQFAIYFAQRRTEADDSLTLARTPDDVRECEDVVREALCHVNAGVALTDIAIAVPDARHVASLKHALLRANLPATFLVGPPLSASSAAGFLRAALDLAEGSRTAEAWYRFLSLPGLKLRAVVGVQGTAKRGRWRKLLRHSGVQRGPALLEAVAAWMPPEDARDPIGDVTARESLGLTLQAISAQLDLLIEPDTWAELASSWSAFLHRWWASSADRASMSNLLSGPGDRQKISLTDARSNLTRLLDATPQLAGTLSDRAIRVAAPMNLLGGQFRVVLAMGLTDGRFPTRAHEDPFLPDKILRDLNRELGIQLPTSHAHIDRERRRFAALVASCTETLWLSSPAMDMAQDRPLLPSPFLLDVLRAVGVPPTYASLEQHQVEVGSRSDVLPVPERALDAAEHRAARILQAPAENAGWMCAHVLHRAQVSRLLLKDAAEANIWNGLITSPLPAIPGWEDDGVSAFMLQFLLTNPERYLLRYVFRAYPAKQFPRLPDPFDRKTRQRALLDLFDVDHDIEGTVAAYDGEIAERFGGEWPVGMRELALQIARTDAEKVHLVVPEVTPAEPLVGVALDAELPWRLGGEHGFTAGDVFYSLDLYAPRKDLLDGPAVALHAMATGAREWQALTPFGRQPKPLEVSGYQNQLLGRLRASHAAVSTGWWPREVPE